MSGIIKVSSSEKLNQSVVGDNNNGALPTQIEQKTQTTFLNFLSGHVSNSVDASRSFFGKVGGSVSAVTARVPFGRMSSVAATVPVPIDTSNSYTSGVLPKDDRAVSPGISNLSSRQSNSSPIPQRQDDNLVFRDEIGGIVRETDQKFDQCATKEEMGALDQKHRELSGRLDTLFSQIAEGRSRNYSPDIRALQEGLVSLSARHDDHKTSHISLSQQIGNLGQLFVSKEEHGNKHEELSRQITDGRLRSNSSDIRELKSEVEALRVSVSKLTNGASDT